MYTRGNTSGISLNAETQQIITKYNEIISGEHTYYIRTVKETDHVIIRHISQPLLHTITTNYLSNHIASYTHKMTVPLPNISNDMYPI